MFVKTQKLIASISLYLSLLLLLSSPSSLEGVQRHTPQRYNVYQSDEKKFIWFRVFKVASGSIKNVLQAEVPDLVQSRPKKLPENYTDFFKFTFVRNPWDRVLSCYFHKVVTKKASDFEECFDKDFDYFVDFIDRLDVATTNSHIKLQTRLIPVQQLDFIGKLENFENDLKHVCNVIGIKCREIPHKHKTEHAHYSTYYTPRTRQIIAEKYREDIEAFGFTFETKTN